MNTHGIGIHPNDGVVQSQGTLAYPRPLCTRMGAEMVDTQGMVSVANDGYFATGAPGYSTFGRER